MSKQPENQGPPAVDRPQFGLAALLGTVLNVALMLAYLRTFDDGWLVIEAAVLLPLAAVFSCCVGFFVGRTKEACFWGATGAIVAFLATANVVLPHSSLDMIWWIVGAFSGAIAGGVKADRPFRRTFFGCVAGGAAMTAQLAGLKILTGAPPLILAGFEIACAVLAGSLMGAFVEGVIWLERRVKIPRYLTTTFLITTIIAGSWLSGRTVSG